MVTGRGVAERDVQRPYFADDAFPAAFARAGNAACSAGAGAGHGTCWSIADDLAYLDPPAALHVRAGHPLALGSVAEFNWALGRYDVAQRLAQQASAANPLNGAGYRVLALVAAAKGEQARAVALMQAALQRTPGDLTARRWLAESAQATGDWRAALPLQDRLLRQAPEEGAVWFEEWTTRLREPAVRAAMVPVLAAAPCS